MIIYRWAPALWIAVAVSVAPATGQVVQLPSFQTFSYSGSVVVPDSGTTSLGGVGRAASGSSRRGLSRSFGQSLGTSQTSVTATIIDLEAIDRQLLGVSPPELVSHGRARTRLVDPTEEGKALVRYARAKYREGDRSTAFDIYQMAIAALPPGRLRQLAVEEFRRVGGSPVRTVTKLSPRR